MKPFQAFPGQDHQAHIDAHLAFMGLNMVRNNPSMMAAIQKNILEHITLMATEQVQMEFAAELMQIQQMTMMAAQNPQLLQQINAINQKIEARKAILVAELTADYTVEENRITSQLDGDPLLKLKAREVDLRAMENERKSAYDKARVDIDTSKLMMNQDIHDDKLDQNEELAELRADTSLEKQEMANDSREKLARMKPKGSQNR